MIFKVRVRVTENFDLAIIARDAGEAFNKAAAMYVDDVRSAVRCGKPQEPKKSVRFARPAPHRIRVGIDADGGPRPNEGFARSFRRER